MYARVVRFTDATPEQIAAVVSRVEESDGPPPGVDAVGMQLMVDERQGTAIFIGLFDDEQKLPDANAILEGLDATDTPGTRASVDVCEVKIERSA